MAVYSLQIRIRCVNYNSLCQAPDETGGAPQGLGD